jgi:hypothetical protein
MILLENRLMALTLASLRASLVQNPNAAMHFLLPDGDMVPPHFHITEVGRVQKDFIDCGGTVRSSTTCLLQVWVASDTEHRLKANKLLAILNVAEPLLGQADLALEVEYEGQTISQFPITQSEITPAGLLFHLGSKHTACLAPDKCGIPLGEASSNDAGSSCGPKGCC